MELITDKRRRKRFGNYIKGLRILNGLTLRQAGDKIDIPFGMLACIERGEPTKITMRFLYLAAETYGVEFDELCKKAERIPLDIYYKVAQNPGLWEPIRNMEV